jgi:nucleoside-diphosphate-sugar epimerase
LEELCAGVETVVHLAGRAHVLNDNEADPIIAFRRVNVDATLKLAKAAAASGVKRFVFVSSIGVSGTETLGVAFSEESVHHPQSPYAVSKFEAEELLKELVKRTSMELVIIRPPLVYAGDAPGNFARLLKLVGMGLPLPFLASENRRSLVALENLIDFIIVCMEHPAAAGETFLISDGTDVSTADIVRAISTGMGRRPRLIYIPVGLIRWGARLLRRENLYSQLFGSLVIDSSKAQRLLGWTPQVSTSDALRQAGNDYMKLLSTKGRD